MLNPDLDSLHALPNPNRQVVGISPAHKISPAILFLSLALVAAPRVANAQLPYDRTTFLNGFASDSVIWTQGYRDLSGSTPPAYLGQYVGLRSTSNPDVNDSLTFDAQVDRVAPRFQSGQHVVVGHSLGSMVSRTIYINNLGGSQSNITGIVALAATHSGTKLADNADEAVRFFADVQRRVNGALGTLRVTGALLNLWSYFVPGGPSLLMNFVSVVFTLAGNRNFDLDELANLTKVPALAALKTNSNAVNVLTTRFEDAAIPRANIYGTIPFRNAVLRLQKSLEDKDHEFDGFVKDRNRLVSIFKACKYLGYGTIVFGGHGRKCAYAAKVMQRIDDRWAKYVNGSDGNGNPRFVPFDGIVANERSVYPSPNGVNYDRGVALTNHQNIYKTRRGLDRVAEGMIIIQMEEIQAPPGGGGGGGTPPPDPPPCEPVPPELQCAI